MELNFNQEKSIVGSIIKDNTLLEDFNIHPDLFIATENKQLVEAMWTLKRQDKPIDYFTLGDAAKNVIDRVGMPYLVDASSMANDVNFDKYLDSLKESWQQREKRRILNEALQSDLPIDQIKSMLDEITTENLSDYHHINDLIAKHHEVPYVKNEELMGVTTGVGALDSILGGYNQNKVIVVGARPGMGKTDFIIQSAAAVGRDGGLPIIFSLEMTADELYMRAAARELHTNRIKMRNPNKYFTEEEKKNWVMANGELSRTNLNIHDKPRQSVAEMRAKARRLINRARETNPNVQPVIFIDYLTIIKADEGFSEHEKVGNIMKDIKDTIAKEFNCSVVVLAQLNRGVEQRQNKRPMLADLRESGNIEESADTVIFLYRERYYDMESEDETIEFIVEKHRGGARGKVTAIYHEATGKILDMEKTE